MIRRRALLAAALASPLAARARAETNQAAQPISRLDQPWWHDRHREKLAARADRPSLVWLGDSITQNFEKREPPEQDYGAVWDRYYAPRGALNLGFSGDTTANVLWRVENGEVDEIAPAALVMLVGANNLGLVHWDADRTVGGIDAILGVLRAKVPRAKIVLLGVLPRGGDAWVTDNHRAINGQLASRTWPENIVFRDPSPLFMTRDAINDELYVDPHLRHARPALHPTPQGMARLAEFIEPLLAPILPLNSGR